MSEKNITQRINAVMKDVTYVQKDKSVSGGGQSYRAVTYDNVIGKLRASLVTHGIVVACRQCTGEIITKRDPGTLTTINGEQKVVGEVKMMLYSGEYIVDFINVDDQSQVLSVPVHAHAQDNGDKAPGKAMTYATKMAILKVFALETGEDEESRYAEDAPAVDVAALLAQVQACQSVDDLNAKRAGWIAACGKDVQAWESVKAAGYIRAKELRGE